MAEQGKILTKASYQKLQEELEDLKVNKRKEIAQKIKEAREQGDLSENAEYDAAKDEQRDIEAHIEELENLLKNAEIIDHKKIDFDKIHMGCKVKIRDMGTRREMTYEIVPSTEVNSREKKISYESPIGAALMNKEVGEVVEIQIPAGTIRYKVLEIQKAEV
ncbi:MAG: transcription elongation factor GreA [Lachnospiraceae bacterium]|jgi:transcription elongation factor GreA|nr:transcription elongation factor GreA [Lachnospiraceae bacterium]MDO4529439.1 transcription elongation factor GreA [Lachnospiraceae bacterium]MDO4735072.1 transcription elongation factor GreA [Lachnospiraceae bacterium]